MNAPTKIRPWHIVFFIAIFSLLSCKQLRLEESSAVNGIINSHAIVIKPRTVDDLARITVDLVKSIQKLPLTSALKTESEKDLKEVLSAVYLKALLDIGGLPRAQGVGIFRLILAPDQNLCAGVPCNQILRMDQKDVEPFFDSLAKSVDSSPIFTAKNKEYERDILKLSLARPTPSDLIRDIGKSERLSIPKKATRPDEEILSGFALTLKLGPKSYRALRGYTEDDFKGLRFVEAHTDNELLSRGYRRPFIDFMRSQINDIRVAFSNPEIPRVKAPVYRGMHDVSSVDLSHYIYHSQTGVPIGLGPEHRGAMTSASWDPNVADHFIGHSRFGKGYNVIFEIKNHGGMGIENISMAPFEREVLIPGNKRFTITGVHQSKERSNLYLVRLEGLPN